MSTAKPPLVAHEPSFTIVIPAFNAVAHVAECLLSCRAQIFDPMDFEVILVDDCSSDGTYELATTMAQEYCTLRVARTTVNGGPGIARNLGVELARGEWILFLDSDDILNPPALSRLAAFLAQTEGAACDVVGFDWQHMHGAAAAGARRDHRFLALDKFRLLQHYLSLHMDGSVIFTAVRRSLLESHLLSFAAGYHEDVDYLFKIYWHARRVGYLDAVLYGKRRRPGSIVESISTRHVAGFVRAWHEIGHFLLEQGAGQGAGAEEALMSAYRAGIESLIATRVREVHRLSHGVEAACLHEALYTGYLSLRASWGDSVCGELPTQYSQIARHFVSAMADGGLDPAGRTQAIHAGVTDLLSRSWSCTDLHHSVFLAPDQVRTCCKRFFVKGEIRGDVVLRDAKGSSAVSGAGIVEAKQALHTSINRGEVTACDGCPFLEFKEWGPIQPMTIRYLSFEYHSVCNLECTYCSDTYYGGVKPRYDVKGLAEGFIADRVLDPNATVVWGGGEPVIDANFTPIIEYLVERLPNLTQRVLTNSVTYSATVDRLLAANRISITTSLDAGTKATFSKVRGFNRFDRVVRHLKRYATTNAANVTIKYIFTDGNESIEECRAFVEVMRTAGLTVCNFQISHDFKSETVDPLVLVSAVALYGLLVGAGCRVVFFDDLLRHRLVGMDAVTEASVRGQLEILGLGDVLIDAGAQPTLAIWGAGWQAKYLLENASFFKVAQPAFIVDSTPSKIGGQFLGIGVRDPRELLESDIPVLIAAVQGYPAIYGEFIRLGLSPSRLVTKLVI